MPTHSSAIRRGLVDLAKRSTSRTLMQEVTEALPDIEKALAAGASYAQVCETFNANGVPLTVMALRTYLYRLRKAATDQAPATAAAKVARKTASRSTKR